MIDREHVEAWMLLLGFNKDAPTIGHWWTWPDRIAWRIWVEVWPCEAVAPVVRWTVRTTEGVQLRTTDPADALEKIKQLMGDQP